jgi:hypothetical protein
VSFDEYKSYVESSLGAPGAPLHLLATRIEEGCWALVEKRYAAAGYAHISSEDVHKLWRIFNRVSLKDSYTEKGPVADPEEVSWLMEKITNTLGKNTRKQGNRTHDNSLAGHSPSRLVVEDNTMT